MEREESKMQDFYMQEPPMPNKDSAITSNGGMPTAVKYSTLSPPERRAVRWKYVEAQNNLCYWCGSSLTNEPPRNVTDKKVNWALFPPNFLKYPVHLQHNHKTDYTEGAVHAYCNAVMWQYHGR